MLWMIAAWSVLVGQPDAAPSSEAPGTEKVWSESIEDYEPRELRGFELRVNRDLVERDPDLLDRVLLHLEHDIDMIELVVPTPAMERLRGVTIWIELQGARIPGGMSGRGMCYHASRKWVSSHGLVPEKAGGVEVIRAEDYLSWRRNQPWMLFHELAHAYHHMLGVGRADVAGASDAATEAGLYDTVYYNHDATGLGVRAYAASNPTEYFAELSEAYFGLNDYFPFSRGQLRAHDARGHEVVAKLWGLSEAELAREIDGQRNAK